MLPQHQQTGGPNYGGERFAQPQPPGFVPNQNQWPTTAGMQPPPPNTAQGVPPPYPYPHPSGSPHYNPISCLSPEYQASLNLLAPVRQINLCEGDGAAATVAVDENRQRLFNMLYTSYVHHTTVHSSTVGAGSHRRTRVTSIERYNYKLDIVNFQGTTFVHADFPGVGEDAVPIFAGDRMLGTATVPNIHAYGGVHEVARVAVKSLTPGSLNHFGFEPGLVIQVVRRPPGERALPSAVGRRPPNPADIVATLEINTPQKRGRFCIEFVDPQLDVEGKILILAVAQYVRTVIYSEGDQDCCCTIL